MLVFSLLLCLGLTMAQSDQEPDFMVFLPSVLHYPAEEHICFHIEEDKGKFSSLIANMKSESGTIKLHEVKDTERDPFSCGTFQVPRPSETQEKVTVEVRGVTSPDSSQYLSSQSVTIRMKNNGTFIQTDKKVYKPGDDVKFRIVKLNQDMEASNEMHPLIAVEDPNRNRMAQFKNVVPKNGIVDLSYQLDPGAALGSYSIIAGEKNRFFTVEEYTLPRFSLNVLTPPTSVMDETLTITICGKYTYGQPVQGNVTYKVCQKKQRYWWGRRESDEDQKDLCHHHTDKTDESGCLESNMDLSNFKVRDSRYERNLDVEASMEEEGTGIRINATAKKIEISSQITKISFKDTKRHFHPGAPYRGKVLLESFNGKPLRGQKVHLTISVNGDTTKETYETDSAGEVSFKLPTTTWGKDSVSIRAFTDDSSEEYERNRVAARYGSDSLHLEAMYVNSEDSVHIRPVRSNAACHENVKVQVDYNHRGGKTKRSIDSTLKKFFYLVLSRSKIIFFGMKTLNVGNSYGSSGTLDISLPLRDISPNGKMLVFTVDDSGGMAADTTTFQVTPCLKQNVTLGFSEDKVVPGTPVNMNLRAEPGSLCALRVVDTSVVMMNPDGELTQDKFQNLVKPEPVEPPNERLDRSMCHDRGSFPSWEANSGSFSPWHRPYSYSYPVKKKDIVNLVQEMGITILTNRKVKAPVTCKYDRGIWPRRLYGSALMAVPGVSFAHFAPAEPDLVFDDVSLEGRSDAGPAPEKPASKETRVYFPETWLWSLHSIPSSGSADIPVTAPDAITEWKGQMFCNGKKGLALSPDATLRVFQPFFTELSLPPSVQRGESFSLRATVFNYKRHALQLEVAPSDSEDVHMKDASSKVKSFCLCAGEKKTVSWLVTLKKLGEINITVSSQALSSQESCRGQEIALPEKGRRDTVIQPLLVKPEGTMVEKTHNSLLICDGSPVEEQVNLELPTHCVNGSEEAFLFVFGDLMSSALNNLDKLLAMSCGCGEQNMVGFAPNVYILQYLRATNQLSPEISKKGCDFLKKGYQRQLSFKHEAGCYSAFGKSDKEGSTWLTAFVIKSFKQASHFIYIDEKNIQKGIKWLEGQQKPDGRFRATGRLLNNALKGGVDDEATLTAYVVSALMESGMTPADPMVKKGLAYLKKVPLEGASVFKLATIAYALALAGDSDSTKEHLKKLDDKGTRADGLVYWTQTPKSESDDFWSKPNSVAVETTSYVLLSHMSAKNVSKKEIGNMVPTMRWLSKQQNANGGFCSTQDTVVALQALAKFGSVAFSKSGKVKVTVSSKKGFQHQFHVDDENRLILQRASLPHMPGQYTVSASGEGSVYIQVTQRYHTPPAETQSPFTLSAVTRCAEKDLLEISVEFGYQGRRNSTNMALLYVKIISGYIPKKDSMEKLKENPMVKRVETTDDSATIYIEKVTSQPQSLVLQAERKVPVSNLKPAIMKISDYYIPEEEKTISYTSNCP